MTVNPPSLETLAMLDAMPEARGVGLNAEVAEALGALCAAEDIPCRRHGSLAAFLEDYGGGPACLVVDAAVNDDALALRRDTGHPLAVVIVSEAATVAEAVAAIKAGAEDYLDWPADARRLGAAVRHGLRAGHRLARRRLLEGIAEERFASLTQREREVIALVAEGYANKEVARELDISPRTVEVHRAHVMEKLGVDNVSRVVRLVLGDVTALHDRKAARRGPST